MARRQRARITMRRRWTRAASVIIGVGILMGVGALLGRAQTPHTPQSPKDYSAAVWDNIHFPPAIDKATDQQCLACHQEVLDTNVRSQTPAGVEADDVLGWYQTLDTYAGQQETFHRRHLVTPYAKEVMSLSCNFCHRGQDPRENAPGSSATVAPAGSDAGFTLRKNMDPSHTCLRCHGNSHSRSWACRDRGSRFAKPWKPAMSRTDVSF